MFKVIAILMQFFTRKEKFIALKFTLISIIFSIADIFAIVLVSFSIFSITQKSLNFVTTSNASANLFAKFITIFNGDTNLILIITFLFIFSKSLLNILFQFLFLKFLRKMTENLGNITSKRIFSFYPESTAYLNQADAAQFFNYSLPSTIIGGVSAIVIILSDCFCVIFLLIIGLKFNTFVALYSSIFYIIVYLFIRIVVGSIHKNSSQVMLLKEIESVQHINQLFDGARELMVYGKMDPYREFTMKERGIGYRASARYMLTLLVPKFILESTLILGVLIMVTILRFEGALKSEIIFSISLFVILASKIIPSTLRIQFYSSMLQKVRSDAIHLENFLNKIVSLENEIRTPITTTSSKALQSFIVFDGVSFQYPLSKNELFSNINFEIQRGEHVNILGSNGVGKSTVLDLITGFKIPSKGFITVAGIPPRDFVQSHKNGMAYVQQKSVIFVGNIQDNLMIETDSMDFVKYQWVELLELLGFDAALISRFENGDWIRENGKNLSGGQIQKIALARALVRNPDILVLDEATNSLDQSTEYNLLNLIKSDFKKTTVISVTHRNIKQLEADSYLLMSGNRIDKYYDKNEVLGKIAKLID